MNYKKDEIKQHLIDYVRSLHIGSGKELRTMQENGDLHQQAYNEDYYLIGTYACERWLIDGKANMTFDVINYIKDYEQDNFGEVYTDLSSPEKVVNMYAYIIGEEILSEMSYSELREIWWAE